MHRWDSRLRPPPAGVSPVRWRDTPLRRRSDASTGNPALPQPVSRSQLRGPGWRRSSRGLYVPSGLPATPEQRIAEAAALLPGYGAVGGWAAAYLLGVRFLDGRGAGGLDLRPVLLCLGPDGRIRSRDTVSLSRERLPSGDVLERNGTRCTAPMRTAFDGSRLESDLVEAVVHLDMMLTSCRLDRDLLGAYIAAHPGWRGVARARRAYALSVAGSRSPPETRLRLAWVLEAELPLPLVNQPVFDGAGTLLGYPDCSTRSPPPRSSTTVTTTATWRRSAPTTSGRNASSTTGSSSPGSLDSTSGPRAGGHSSHGSDKRGPAACGGIAARIGGPSPLHRGGEADDGSVRRCRFGALPGSRTFRTPPGEVAGQP